jgi:nucleotide-binding universal stress UspA family protein
MTVTTIVAYQPGVTGLEALRLGGFLARSTDSRLLVTMVMETPSAPSVARVDFQYTSLLRQQLTSELEEAKRDAPNDVEVDFRIHDARSVPGGLVELAATEDADLIVVGNASRGVLGRVSLGGVTNHLVHSSPVPIALAPRGFHTQPQDRVSRVNAAYGGVAGKSGLVLAAAGLCTEMSAELRLTSFSLQSRSITTDLIAEDELRATVTADVRDHAAGALADVRALPHVPKIAETVVGFGEDWDDAIEHVDWDDGDVLVVGSSDMGPGHRVFLGSTGMRIVHESPVPVIVVPGGAVQSLVDRAEDGQPGGDR